MDSISNPLMCNSNFDKNGIDKYGTHWLQYAAIVVTAFAIYFAWAFYNDAKFPHYRCKNIQVLELQWI